MKKIVILFIAFYTTQYLVSQNNYPHIKEITTNHSIFSASLGDETTTFYLKKIQFAPLSTGSYSVKGWMGITSSNKKKNIVGVYVGNKLTLYYFKDKVQEKAVLNFKTKGTPRERIKKAQRIESFIFKIVFRRTEKGIVGSYETSGKKEQMLLLSGNIATYKEQRILQLNSKEGIDLLQLSRFYRNVEIKASNNNKILLSYTAQSTYYTSGRCAAGEEKGYSLLTFNKDGLIENVRSVNIEGCLIDISTTKEEQESDFITHYYVTNYTNNTAKKVSVNLKTVSLTIQDLQ